MRPFGPLAERNGFTACSHFVSNRQAASLVQKRKETLAQIVLTIADMKFFIALRKF
jgi:hypothetical protein